jgi:DNA gyrase subunit A
MVVSEQGFGKRSDIEDYRVTRRGAKGVKTLNVTDKTGKLVAIKCVTDDDDIMIINKSGITLRLHLKDVRIIGRATQGVRLINLTKRNDHISSVCKVLADDEENTEVDPVVEETVDGQLVSYSNEDAPQAPDTNEENNNDNN